MPFHLGGLKPADGKKDSPSQHVNLISTNGKSGDQKAPRNAEMTPSKSFGGNVLTDPSHGLSLPAPPHRFAPEPLDLGPDLPSQGSAWVISPTDLDSWLLQRFV